MTQDWPDLLGAALRDPARTLFYPLTCAPGAQFVAHRAPPVWSRDAEMLEHLLREAPACHPWLLLSWAAHFPDLSPEGWARMTARVRDTAAALTGGAPAALTVQALTILGARDRDALDRLERDAAIDDATLPRLCERARELVQARRLHRGYAELLAVTRAMGDTLPLL
jgi:hypothetical protein